MSFVVCLELDWGGRGKSKDVDPSRLITGCVGVVTVGVIFISDVT